MNKRKKSVDEKLFKSIHTVGLPEAPKEPEQMKSKQKIMI